MSQSDDSFSLQFQRDLLRALYTSPLSTGPAFEVPLPLAPTLTLADYSTCIGQQIDPWAQGVDRQPPRRRVEFSLSLMIIGAQFSAAFPNRANLEAVVAPQALTLIEIGDAEERKRVAGVMDRILAKVGQLFPELPPHRHIKSIAYGDPHDSVSDADRTARSFNIDLGLQTAKGQSALVYVPSADCLPKPFQPLVTGHLVLPPVSRDLLIEVLRQTHSCTEQLAEREIRDRLPKDADLAEMSFPALRAALHADTSLAVATRLQAYVRKAQDLRKRSSITLDSMSLPALTRDAFDQLLADLSAWRAKELDWSEVTASFLLYGPPGNGKTLLAEALSGTANIPLISTSYAECQKAGHQGDMLLALSNAVDHAIRRAPSIFFIDELDSFSRRDKPSRNSDYIKGVVNALLEHLTRLASTSGVIILGATNYPEMIDPAIIRPGRFDRKIEFGNPDHSGILRILEIAIGGDICTGELIPIADQLVGVSAAQVTAIVRDARGRARHRGETLDDTHLRDSAQTLCPAMAPELEHRVAVHEASHAVVGHALGALSLEKLRITQTGGELLSTPKGPLTLASAKAHLAVLLAGRAAEMLCFGDVSTGAETDLRMATDLAFKMRHAWGFYPDTLLHAEELHLRIPSHYLVSDLNREILHAEARATEIISNQRDVIDRVARELIRKRELTREDLFGILNGEASGQDAKVSVSTGASSGTSSASFQK
ncbi:AAA family ATPase [Pacificibacter marinus]|uniref:ATP-dependent zinc metalloprotease FtsH n=1 Tax=Pacificibacter marinus TaxID=658057 RepID=A0A1Y5T410_9RHOB|nr:AAA family ATPase [Pacificibacter marinus]SEL00328.1 Peptidase family M41 [Pacificibacter marinus]SLN54747.1 ATP-dependent zinc metalloprotease FtsH [Pacificibacter marinus]